MRRYVFLAAAAFATLGTAPAAHAEQRPMRQAVSGSERLEDLAARNLNVLSVAMQSVRLNTEGLLELTREPGVYDRARALLFVDNIDRALDQADQAFAQLTPLARGRFAMSRREVSDLGSSLQLLRSQTQTLRAAINAGVKARVHDTAQQLSRAQYDGWSRFKTAATSFDYDTSRISSR